MARPTTESQRVTAFLEPSQQLQTQVSDWSFRITPPSKRAAAQAVAVVDRICATARRALRLTAALLGVAAFAALSGTAQTATFTAAQRTLGSGFSSPTGVAVDSTGNLFVADEGHNAVKEILAAGGYTTVNTLAVTNGQFSQPRGVAVDAGGNVYVADSGYGAVKEILATGGYTTVDILGSGLPNNLYGVAVGASGTVFVADTASTGIVEVQPDAANFGAVNVKTASSVFSLIFTFVQSGLPRLF